MHCGAQFKRNKLKKKKLKQIKAWNSSESFFPSKRCLNMTQIFSKQPSVELNVTFFNGKQLHSLALCIAHW